MSGQPDLYDILGVRRNATSEDITNKYRDISRVCHPDNQRGSNQQTREKRQRLFEAATVAHNVLSNSLKRQMYDCGLDPFLEEKISSPQASYSDMYTVFNSPQLSEQPEVAKVQAAALKRLYSQDSIQQKRTFLLEDILHGEHQERRITVNGYDINNLAELAYVIKDKKIESPDLKGAIAFAGPIQNVISTNDYHLMGGIDDPVLHSSLTEFSKTVGPSSLDESLDLEKNPELASQALKIIEERIWTIEKELGLFYEHRVIPQVTQRTQIVLESYLNDFSGGEQDTVALQRILDEMITGRVILDSETTLRSDAQRIYSSPAAYSSVVGQNNELRQRILRHITHSERVYNYVSNMIQSHSQIDLEEITHLYTQDFTEWTNEENNAKIELEKAMYQIKSKHQDLKSHPVDGIAQELQRKRDLANAYLILSAISLYNERIFTRRYILGETTLVSEIEKSRNDYCDYVDFRKIELDKKKIIKIPQEYIDLAYDTIQGIVNVYKFAKHHIGTAVGIGASVGVGYLTSKTCGFLLTPTVAAYALKFPVDIGMAKISDVLRQRRLNKGKELISIDDKANGAKDKVKSFAERINSEGLIKYLSHDVLKEKILMNRLINGWYWGYALPGWTLIGLAIGLDAAGNTIGGIYAGVDGINNFLNASICKLPGIPDNLISGVLDPITTAKNFYESTGVAGRIIANCGIGNLVYITASGIMGLFGLNFRSFTKGGWEKSKQKRINKLQRKENKKLEQTLKQQQEQIANLQQMVGGVNPQNPKGQNPQGANPQ